MKVELTFREIEILVTVLNNDQRRCIKDGNHYEACYDSSMAKKARKRAKLLEILALKLDALIEDIIV